MVAIFSKLCLWRRSLCSNLGGIGPGKLYRATLSLSYNPSLKISLSVKIQHPANNTCLKAGPSVKTFTDKETTNQGSLVCSHPDPGILVGEKEAKILI